MESSNHPNVTIASSWQAVIFVALNVSADGRMKLKMFLEDDSIHTE